MAAVEPAEPPSIQGLSYIGVLGSGGYADVFEYEQAMPRRKVAVKVLRAEGLSDAITEQFTAEANAMAELADHPNIVSVLAADVTPDGRPYLVMMLYARDNLAVRATSERFAVSEVLRIGVQIASAVETAHQAGILHRDIKPANVLTNQYGTVGLTDFGIAAQTSTVDDDEEDAGVSVPWCPPEVLFATGSASPQSDVYSLGATLWHLLVGRAPFEVVGGDNSTLGLMRRARDSPVPPTGRADVPASFEQLLAQALAKTPAVRPSSALSFARSLQAVEQELRLPRTEIVVLHEPSDAAAPSRRGPEDPQMTRLRSPKRVDPEPPQAKQESARAGGGSRTGGSTPARSVRPSAPAAGQTTVRRAPSGGTDRGLVGSPPGSAGRQTEEGSAAATVRRAPKPEEVHDDEAAVGEARRPGPQRRVGPYLVVLAIAFVGIIGGAVLLASGGGSTTSPPSTLLSEDIPGADSGGPPGPATVAGVLMDDGTAQFTWTYSNRFDTDSFLWRYSDGRTGGEVAEPALSVSADAAQTCIQVKVVRADGSNAQIAWSEPGCAS